MESHCQRETSGSEILNSESDYKKVDDSQQDIMKENLVHHDETKDKSMNMNGSVSREASHKNYNKHRNGPDASVISTHGYRKSFDTANRIKKKKNKKKAMRELQVKQNLFPNSSRRAMVQKSAGDDGLQKSKQKQKQDFQEKSKQHHGNVKSRKLMGNILNKTTIATTTSCTLTTASFIGHNFNFTDTFQHLHQNNNTNGTSFNLTVDVITDDYAHGVAMGWTLFQKESHDLIIDSNGEDFTSRFYANTTYVFDYYCVVSYGGSNKMNETVDDVVPTCFEFAVHNSQTDEMLSDFGSSINVTMSINNKEKATLTNPGRDTSSVNASFCLDFNEIIFNQEPFNTVFVLDDDYAYYDSDKDEMNVNTGSSDIIHIDEKDIYHTSCVLMEAEIIPPCDDNDDALCMNYAYFGRCTATSIVSDYSYHYTWQDTMLQYCPKTCDACPPPISLLENQINFVENGNTITTFNLSLNVNTDKYMNETSWFFGSGDRKGYIFNSNESNYTSQLEYNAGYKFSYKCIISLNEERENELSENEMKKSTCYNFEVHDSFGDGICCEYGDGFFSMNINTNRTSLKIEDEFKDGISMSSSFCLNHSNGEIESEGRFITTEQPTHYPFKRWQCKNDACVCDSKPSLTSNTQENHSFLLEVTILSDSDDLRDMESAQYKAACWVLYDDPFEYDISVERMHKRMIQRYVLAVFYFATSPENWKEHYDFLSSSSECNWNYVYYSGGIKCDGDGNVIIISVRNNYLDGTIVDEISGLRVLEYLNLHSNNIHRNIPSMLGRLYKLRYLDLSENDLEGTIPDQLFNATNLEELHLGSNRLEGTIPQTIGNLQKLYWLDLGGNNLSGSIPDAIYTLKNLWYLKLNSNKLSSSIPKLIGNLKKLEYLSLSSNVLTGQIPSTIGSLSQLERLYLENNMLSGSIPSTTGNMTSLKDLWLNNNMLSGPIPESLFDLPDMYFLKLQENSVTGSIPDQFCENDGLDIQADCQNDVFEPQVSCSCCGVCLDKTPKWNGECPDATMKIVIDQRSIDHNQYSYTSDELEWSLMNVATQKKILFTARDDEGGGTACVAFSDCISIDMLSPPILNTNYQIYWNDVLVEDGIHMFPGSMELERTYEYKNDPFQFDRESQELVSCRDIKLLCDDGNGKYQIISVARNSTMISSVSKVLSMFGSKNMQDPSSPQSKALCWVLLQNENSSNELALSDKEILQRYALTMLHFSSTYRLFGEDEYPPESHECDWPGIQCKQINDTQIVISISLSSDDGQIINGTLIDELGGLQFLETLEMNRTQLRGTIPETFSNLWSLKKLDLSENEINGTLPVNMFHQLNKLEHMNLSNNLLSGNINEDIGSFSHIRVLSIKNNSLSGSLPMRDFKFNDLEYLDVSGNDLNSVEFDHLIKHTKLKTLDLSTNFFVGSLHDGTFTSLTKLEYFNISQNDFSGTIPSKFSDVSDITHIDMHSNRFKGPIPLSITDLSYIQHINLQGNQLTGSLPSQLNNLENLTTLVLSHNELKGSIPFKQNKLWLLNLLHLHSNKLSGEAPRFSNMDSYITDCGFPSDLSDPVTCPSCSTCCNSLDRCRVTKVDHGKMNRTLIFSLILIGLLILSYLVKAQIISLRKLEPFFSRSVSKWNPLAIMNDKSVYHFLLTNNKIGWRVALGTGAFQILTLFLFVVEASSYSLKCPFYSLKCEDTEPGINASPLGLLLFGLILIIWLTRDLVSSVKLLLIALYKKNIDIMFTGGLVLFITALAAWTSIYYNFATVTTDHELIVNTVILLFVLEADERIYQFAESFTPQWVIDEARFRESAMFDGDELIISSWIRKRLRKRSSMPSQLSKNEQEEEEEDGEKGEGVSHEMNLNETFQVEKLP